MKMQIIISVLFIITRALGCYQMNLGPKTDVTNNGAGGRWILVSYFVHGRRQANTDAAERALLQAEAREVNPDSTYPSKIYQRGHWYRTFQFTDFAGGSVSRIMAISYGHDFSKKRMEETHWYRLDNDHGFLVTLDLKDGKSTKLEMSNVMKSEVYQPGLDTARYVYVPN